MFSARVLPVGGALSATLSWGVMFPILAAVLSSMDPYQISAERYVIAAAVLLAIVAVREGRAALSFAGRAGQVALLGLAGFTVFNILLLLGVRAAGPQHGSLFMATVPTLAVIVQSVRTRTAPPLVRIPFVAAAFAGVTLVVTAGHGLRPGGALGDLALFGAALSWVTYTIGAGSLRGWSPLRFTALSAACGAAGLVVVAAAAAAFGFSRVPSAADYAHTAPAMAYLALVGGVYSVVAWTTAVRGLGAQRAALFMNLVPVTAFVLAAIAGDRPAPLEVAGAVMTIVALVGDNVVTTLRSQALAPAA